MNKIFVVETQLDGRRYYTAVSAKTPEDAVRQKLDQLLPFGYQVAVTGVTAFEATSAGRTMRPVKVTKSTSYDVEIGGLRR